MNIRPAFLVGTALAAVTILFASSVNLTVRMERNVASTTACGHLAGSAEATNVKASLHRAVGLQGLDIDVSKLSGDLRLAGTLNRQVQINEALCVARTAQGVNAIHDELTFAGKDLRPQG